MKEDGFQERKIESRERSDQFNQKSTRVMKRIYFDNCSYNRPFDDQSRDIVRLEADAKLYIQELVKDRKLELVWSFVLDYEKTFIERGLYAN